MAVLPIFIQNMSSPPPHVGQVLSPLALVEVHRHSRMERQGETPPNFWTPGVHCCPNREDGWQLMFANPFILTPPPCPCISLWHRSLFQLVRPLFIYMCPLLWCQNSIKTNGLSILSCLPSATYGQNMAFRHQF